MVDGEVEAVVEGEVKAEGQVDGQALVEVRVKVEVHFARGLFSMEEAKDSRKIMQPGEWWEMFGDGTPELRRFAIHVFELDL